MATRKHVLVPLDLVRHSAHARCRHTWLNEAVTPPYDPSRQGRWREKRRCVATVVCWWTGRFKDGAWSPSDNIILSFKNRPKRYFEFWEFRPFKSACTLGFILLFSVIVDLWCLQRWRKNRVDCVFERDRLYLITTGERCIRIAIIFLVMFL